MTDPFAPILADDGDDEDGLYFRERAAWHVSRAAVTADASARKLHERFAEMYTRRAASPSSTN